MPTAETDAPTPVVTLERRGAVALITLNRPRALNAVNADLSAALGTALEEFDADTDLRVAVVTGAGRAFCAGMDLKEAAAGRSVNDPLHPEWGFAGIVRHPVGKPLVAAVNGPALGGGAEIVLACDLVVADENATFGMPEVHHGLFPAAGGVLRLQHRVPRNIAREIALTGTPVDAATGARWGLFNQIAPAGQVGRRRSGARRAGGVRRTPVRARGETTHVLERRPERGRGLDRERPRFPGGPGRRRREGRSTRLRREARAPMGRALTFGPAVPTQLVAVKDL